MRISDQSKSTRFITKHEQNWKALQSILEKLQKNGFNHLSKTEIRDFPKLTRAISTHYAQAKAMELSPDIIQYLNNILGQSHKYLYSFPPIQISAVVRFFTQGIPYNIYKNLSYVFISASILFISMLLSMKYTQQNPEFAYRFNAQAQVDQLAEAYRTMDSNETQLDSMTKMLAFYIHNNVSISFLAFAMGILAGIGTVFILLYNGVMIGSIFGFILSLGYQKNLVSFITAHSVFELTGIVISGAAGLLLGYTLIKSGNYKRMNNILLKQKELFSMVVFSAVLIAIAAFIEGYISPTTIDYGYKLGVMIFCALFVLSYTVIYPFIRFHLPSRKHHGT